MLRTLAYSLALGLSVCGAGAGIIYLYLRKDESLYLDCEEDEDRLAVELEIEEQKVAALIGKEGKNIKMIQEKTKAKITMMKTEEPIDDNQPRICVIKGTPEKVEDAKIAILNCLASIPDIITIEIYVPLASIGRIIGKGGTNIRSLQQQSGAKIRIDNSDAPTIGFNRRIIINGAENHVKLAKSLIEAKVEEEEELKRSLAQCSRFPRSNRQAITYSSEESGSSTPTKHVERLETIIHDGYTDVYVSAMKTPNQFWIQKIGPPSVDLDRLNAEMTEFYDNEENKEICMPKDLVEVGTMVAAKFQGKWYRGKVLTVVPDDYDIQDSQVDVFFVDFGDDTVKVLKELRQLKMEFLKLRHQAIEVGLYGVEPIYGEWTEDALDLFEELSQASQWTVVQIKSRGYRQQPRSNDRASSPIPLIDIIGVGEKNIAEELIAQNHAIRSTSSPVQNGSATPKSPSLSESRSIQNGSESDHRLPPEVDGTYWDSGDYDDEF